MAKLEPSVTGRPNELVIVERRGEVALLTLNRPEVRNAVNVALAEATCEAITDCQDAGAIVLTGADPAFCAGLDLRSLGVDSLGDMPRFVDAVAGSSVPVVAAVNGPAVTAGFELALAADFIVSSDRARFADTHLRVGVYPGPVLVDLPRRVGPAWAREISLTGNFVDADTALRIGIVNHQVPHDELLPFASGLASAIAEGDREMVVAIRSHWDATNWRPIDDARRIHADRRREATNRWRPTAGGIASRRDIVLDRAHRQPGTDGP